METTECTLAEDLIVEAGTRAEYESLAHYHYRDAALGPVAAIFTIRHRGAAAAKYGRRPVGVQILAAFAVSLGAILTGALVRLALNGWSVPSGWLELASRAGEIDPLALSGTITPAASFFGLLKQSKTMPPTFASNRS